MNKNLKKISYLFGLLLLVAACNQEKSKSDSKKTSETDKTISEVQQKFAPDKRVAIFNVESSKDNGKVTLKGESNLSDAVTELKEELNQEKISFVDSIQMLPAKDLDGKTEGVIKISVANLRSKPSHSSELVTQALLGTPVKVMKKEGSWYFIQTPEGYLAWTDYGAVSSITKDDMEDWRAKDKVIYLQPFGQSHQKANEDSQSVSDLVAGNILTLEGEGNNFYKIGYPDGKEAYIKTSEAMPYRDWVASLKPSGKSLTETSKSFMGLPYLWGGTSPKGVDCSGFTKTIYFLNGIILPRDASQQIHTGVLVDSTKNFENLEPGDLLFFGKKATDTSAERVIHVGMWIGNNQFVHSMGDVHISTFDQSDPDFDEYNYNRYLRTKRILNEDDNQLIQLSHSELFMDKKG